MVDRAVAAGVSIRVDTTVSQLSPENRVTTISPSGVERWDPGAVVMAMGCRERPRSARRISGSRAQGVYTTGELQQFTYLLGESIGNRALVYGAEHVSFSALMTLRDAGIEPVAIVTSQPSHQTYESFRRFGTRFGRVPLYTNHTIASIEGASRVSGVWLYFPGWGALPGSDQVLDATGLRDKHRRQTFIECDTVIVSGDWVAEGDLGFRSGLANQLGSGARPRVGPTGTTSRPGVFAAGGLVRPGESAMSASQSGTIAAGAVRSFLRGDADPPLVPVTATSNHFRWLWPDWIHTDRSSPLKFRVDAWLERCCVVILQEDRVLDRIRFRTIVPGRTYQLGGKWMSRVRGTIPIRVEIEME
jgi:thioredoxin reductase